MWRTWHHFYYKKAIKVLISNRCVIEINLLSRTLKPNTEQCYRSHIKTIIKERYNKRSCRRSGPGHNKYGGLQHSELTVTTMYLLQGRARGWLDCYYWTGVLWPPVHVRKFILHRGFIRWCICRWARKYGGRRPLIIIRRISCSLQCVQLFCSPGCYD